MKKKHLKYLFLIFLGALFVMIYKYGILEYFSKDNISSVKDYFLQYKGYTLLILLLIYFIFGVAGIPTFFFTFFAGYVYGVVYGTLIGMVGMCAGYSTTFFISRYLFRDDFEKKFKNKKIVKALHKNMKKHGFWSIVIFRASYVIPTFLLNYVYGVFTISFKRYFLGSFLGLVPVCYINSVLGDLFRIGSDIKENTTQLMISLSTLLFIIILILFFKRKVQKDIPIDPSL